MGWFYDSNYKNDETMTVKKYWEKVYLPETINALKEDGVTVVAKNFHDENTWGESYIALKNKNEKKASCCLVTIFEKNEYGIGNKEMTDSMGPCYYHASREVLDSLGKPKGEFAKEWRDECYKELGRKNKNERKRLEKVFGIER